MGAKNHGVILPDANKEKTLNDLVGAAFGAGGQRCMALSTVVFVGDSKHWMGDLMARAKKLKVRTTLYMYTSFEQLAICNVIGFKSNWSGNSCCLPIGHPKVGCRTGRLSGA